MAGAEGKIGPWWEYEVCLMLFLGSWPIGRVWVLVCLGPGQGDIRAKSGEGVAQIDGGSPRLGSKKPREDSRRE